MKNIVYFLGAGASKAFGNPLTGEIMPLILQRLRDHDLFQLNSRKSPIEKQYEKQLLSWIYLMYPGLRRLAFDSGNTNEAAEKIPGITEVLSLVDHFFFYNLPPHPKIAGDTLQQFRHLLNRAVAELILEYDLEHFSSSEEKLLRRFIAPIRDAKKRSNSTIITTNYDLIIDLEFKNACRQNQVDYGIAYRDIETSKLLYRREKPLLHLYKLHGSLNWLRCDLCGQYYVNPEGHIVNLAFHEAVYDWNTCICSSSLRLQPVLVAPSFVRDIRDPNLLQIWKAALESIRTADELIFIGYSLPSEDLGIRSILMRALNGRQRSQPLEVSVVQKGTGAKQSYINIFGKRIQYYAGGLESYLETVHLH